MKKIVFYFCLFVAVSTMAAPKSGRYDAIDNLQGESLFNALSKVTNIGFHTLTYKGLWDAYTKTDVYPGTQQIWDMYGECGFAPKDKCGQYDGECQCYNREHSIPKSWFGGSESGIGCDIFHVVPTDGKVNNVRDNDPFGEVGSAKYTYNGCKSGKSNFSGYSGTVFEPIDEYKGDFARGYFGTIVKWMLKNMTTKNGSVMFTGNYTSNGGFGLTSYSIALLMKWHRQDPVSQKEIDRNDAIEQTQGNRNPFIDYPYLAEYFWGKKKGQTLDMAHMMSAYDVDFVLGKSDGWRETPVTAIDVIYAEEKEDKPLTDLQGMCYFYTLTGQFVTTLQAETIESANGELPSGLYIVRSASGTTKVAIE